MCGKQAEATRAGPAREVGHYWEVFRENGMYLILEKNNVANVGQG